MRDFSKVSPTVWKSRKFRALNADSDARLAYLYILTNPHINSAGCYDLPQAYACADLEWQIERYAEAIDRLSMAGLILIDGNESTVLVTNWIKFNFPTNPKHALGMLAQLEEASSAQLKALRCNEIRESVEERRFTRDREVGQTILKRIETLSIAYAEGIPTKTETETETERETKTERETETETVSARARNGASSAAPDGASSAPPERQPEPIGSRIRNLLETPLMRRTAQ